MKHDIRGFVSPSIVGSARLVGGGGSSFQRLKPVNFKPRTYVPSDFGKPLPSRLYASRRASKGRAYVRRQPDLKLTRKFNEDVSAQAVISHAQQASPVRGEERAKIIHNLIGAAPGAQEPTRLTDTQASEDYLGVSIGHSTAKQDAAGTAGVP